MLNERKEFVCDHYECGRPATRVLRYFVDSKSAGALDPKTNQFCDQHANEEEKKVQEPGLFWFIENGERVDGFVHELTNQSIEDYCCTVETDDGLKFTRVGASVDPTLWGLAPETRGTVVVRDLCGRRTILGKVR